MGFPESTDCPYAQDARDFLSFVDNLRDEPVVILDIRSNRGGNGTLPTQWLHLLTGEIVPNNYVGLRAQVWDIDSLPDIQRKYLSPALFGEGYMILHNDPNRIIEREQILILLVDRYAGSAAEELTDMILNISNTLVVGSHTCGALNFDRLGDFQMPRTGLWFGFGAGMHIHPEGHLIEGVGIAPDIWIQGDALSAVITMLQRTE
jgi:C-terminal processing protease CtpA/Prc